MWTNEGGISSPGIFHWPNGISARGEIRHNPSHFIDILPTVLEIAGGTLPREIDGHRVPPKPGKSLVPVFERDGTVAHDYLWWMHSKHPAIRMGDWKAVSRDDGVTWSLFNIAEDRGEATDLAAQHPERLLELRGKWNEVAEMFRQQLTE
jgi:arylsulfatase